MASVTTINNATVFPSSINNIPGRLLSEENLSSMLRYLCNHNFVSKHTLVSGDLDPNYNFNVIFPNYGTIYPGSGIVDGYIITVPQAMLLNVPTEVPRPGETIVYLLALRIELQRAPEGNVGNNDMVYAHIAYEFLEDRIPDTASEKYLYLYEYDVVAGGVSEIRDIRNYSPFDLLNVSAIHEGNQVRTLEDYFEFIKQAIRGLTPDIDFFDASGDKFIPIEAENGIYDRLHYQFQPRGFEDDNHPFINEMIKSGMLTQYAEGQIPTLDADALFPRRALPLAAYKVTGSTNPVNGTVFVDPNRRMNATAYNPQNLVQNLFLDNGEIYTTAEVNQNAYTLIQLINPAIGQPIDVSAIAKTDTLQIIAGTNVILSGQQTVDTRQMTIGLATNPVFSTIKIGTHTIAPFINNTLNYRGLDVNADFAVDNLWVRKDATIDGNLTVHGDILGSGDLTLLGNMTVVGELTAAKVWNAVYNDYAELLPKTNTSAQFEPGHIIAKTPSGEGYELANRANKKMVVGVYSDNYGHILGGDADKTLDQNLEFYVPIGLCGNVFVKIYGPIREGDLITVSDIDGVGQASLNPLTDMGCIVGKALQSDTSHGYKLIKMQIMLH